MYNHIFFSLDNEFYNALYYGFMHGEGRKLISIPASIHRSKITNVLIGWKLQFPWLRSVIFFRMFREALIINAKELTFTDNKNKNCYIIYGRVLEFYGPCLLRYLKQNDPEGIFVCYLGDVVSSFTFSISSLKKKFDLIFSCDKKDAAKHEILFLQEPYSYIESDEFPIEFDFSFVGSEKGRLNKILTIYEVLTGNGYKCKFYINGVREEEQRYPEDIIYNHYISYHEVVNIIKKSRCIIEVLQEEADTTTTRYSEALLYHRYLLTDSEYLRNMNPTPPNIIPIDYSCWDNLEKINQPLHYDNTVYIEELSIHKMILSIDNYLN